jgi:hypothetical protein
MDRMAKFGKGVGISHPFPSCLSATFHEIKHDFFLLQNNKTFLIKFKGRYLPVSPGYSIHARIFSIYRIYNKIQSVNYINNKKVLAQNAEKNT